MTTQHTHEIGCPNCSTPVGAFTVSDWTDEILYNCCECGWRSAIAPVGVFDERDVGGVYDGFCVSSDADPGL